MTVTELKALLDALPDDLLVVLSEDAEGNGFSPLASVETAIYVADETWRGQTYVEELDDELRRQGFTEEDLYDGDDGVRAVVLGPVN